MSLVLAARYKGGVLMAADPFSFDDQSSLALRSFRFDKFIIDRGLVVAGVTGMGVINRMRHWIADREAPDDADFLPDLAGAWAECETGWQAERQAVNAGDNNILVRPGPDVLFAAAGTHDPGAIHFGDRVGNIHSTTTAVLSGFGSHPAGRHLAGGHKRFEPAMSLADCLDLAFECFLAASADLMVIGRPSIVLVTSGGVIDFHERCRAIWQGVERGYFEKVKSEVVQAGDSHKSAT